MDKLSGLPKVYYINLDRSEDRNAYMINQFNKYGVINYERVSAVDIKSYDGTSFINHELSFGIKPVEAIVSLSHLMALKKFVDSGEFWAVIMEDDVDISTVENWSFSWNELSEKLPDNLNVLQMVIGTRKSKDINFHIHIRSFWDFCATAYLISREYAIAVLNTCLKDNKVDLSYFNTRKKYDKDNTSMFFQESYPTVEEIIFGIEKNKIYSLPIFSYTMEYESLQNPDHYEQALNSRERVMSFWQNQYKHFELNDIIEP